MAVLAAMGKTASLFSAAVDLVSLLLFLSVLSSVSAQFSAEKMALLEMKRSFSDPHGVLNSWNAGSSNHCTWYGVSCDPDFRVSVLSIGGNLSLSPSCSIKSEPAMHGFGIARNCSGHHFKISGTLSAVVGMFTYLRVLSLPFNGIGGELPVEIWGLRNLEVLDLEGNHIFGHLPSNGFSSLRKLRVLNLASNRIFGKFPPSLSDCKSLRILNLAGNRFNDVIPGFVGGFRKLRVVNLSFNRLIGYIPSDFGYDCENLEHLDMSHNFLTGEIPRAFGKCSRLRTIMLSSNVLYGVIPNELGKLQNLELLNVARNRLGGPLPVNLGNCSHLSVLVLSSHFNARHRERPPRGKAPHGFSDAALSDHNSFEGSIPDVITSLPKLKILWAPGANFEGRFPKNWGSCKSIMMVNLAQNHFTGDIFGLFPVCSDLQYLNLSSNRLSGKLDENLSSSCKTKFDVSGNMLLGRIPRFNANISCQLHPYDPSVAYATFLVNMSYEMQTMDSDYPSRFIRLTSSSSFFMPTSPASDPREGREQIRPPPPRAAPSSNSSDHDGMSTVGMASIVYASGVVSVGLVFLFICCYLKKKGNEKAMTETLAVPQSKEVIVLHDTGAPLTYHSIALATQNFNRRYNIGHGGFGTTYRAEVAPGLSVAVKRLTAERHQGAAQFHAEVNSLGQIQHPNIITLLGYYSFGPEIFLIYNYFPGGNLDQFIRDRARRVYNFSIVHKIALHIATALCYLHEQCNPSILHRDIKSSNILLDDDCNAFLADFGLCKILAPTETHVTTCAAGTYGYVSPEYALTGMLSSKADVYSYGVVLLEMLSGKKALDPSFYSYEDSYNIVSWARTVLTEGPSNEMFIANLWHEGPQKKLVKILHVAALCTFYQVGIRPTMRQVVQRLKEIEVEDENVLISIVKHCNVP